MFIREKDFYWTFPENVFD